MMRDEDKRQGGGQSRECVRVCEGVGVRMCVCGCEDLMVGLE